MCYSAMLLREITSVPQKHQSNQQSGLSQGSISKVSTKILNGLFVEPELSIISHSRAQTN